MIFNEETSLLSSLKKDTALSKSVQKPLNSAETLLQDKDFIKTTFENSENDREREIKIVFLLSDLK